MWLVAIWGMAEATLFFIVADVPISAIGLRRGWRAAVRAAIAASIAATLGGLIVLHWPAEGAYRRLASHIPGISVPMIAQASRDFAAQEWRAMLTGAFTGTPYKLYALAAHEQGTGTAVFALQSLTARLPRFMAVAAVSGWIGHGLRARWSRQSIGIAHAGFWTLFYAAYFAHVGL